MKPIPLGKQLVSFPLASIVTDLLHGYDCVPISEVNAECLLTVTKNKHTCYVQMPGDVCDIDVSGNIISQPMLWSMTHWLASTERWQRQKIRSDRERDERNIYAYNVRLIVRAVLKMIDVTPDMANVLARKTLDKKDYKKIAALGVKKLATTVEEI